MKLRIAILAGDGIGPEVTQQATNILRAVAELGGHDFTFTEGLIGGTAITQTGSPLPTATLDVALESKDRSEIRAPKAAGKERVEFVCRFAGEQVPRIHLCIVLEEGHPLRPVMASCSGEMSEPDGVGISVLDVVLSVSSAK